MLKEEFLVDVDSLTLYRIIGSAAVIVMIFGPASLLKSQAKRTQKRLNLRTSRYFAIRRGLNLAASLLVCVAIILIWGVDVRNLWGGLTSVVAMVAVGFLAVWSLIGNILAGMLIYFTSPFKVDDYIEILPEKISGTVLAINSFFTVLENEDEGFVNIPNSMFFQRFIVNYRNGRLASGRASRHEKTNGD